ncbi:hypothetical protein Tco_1113787 [Tanacetum coccineum]|uniref:Uncharacterized protein n=1 Tax=Tanacetum coccineum TaxID=301880 RepID=A0ABQ5IWW8_9ASTR
MNGLQGIEQGDNTRRTCTNGTSDALVVQDNALIGLTQRPRICRGTVSCSSKNEAIYEETIISLRIIEVKDKSNAVTRLKNQLDETLREKDDLKAKLEQISNEKVNNVRVNGVNTTGQTAVSAIKGNGVTVVKALAGKSQQLEDQRYLTVDVPVMTGNKDYLTNYQDHLMEVFVAIFLEC